MTIFVKKFKKKDGNDCVALMANNGRRERALTFDRYIIADYLGLKIEDVKDLTIGKYHIVDVSPLSSERS